MFTPTTFFRKSESFSPDDLSGLALWHDCQDLSTLTKNGGGNPSNNDPVQQIDDKSGNNIHHSEPTLTLANMPLYVNNDLNGFPALKFDGVNDFLRAPFNAALGTSTFHSFRVCRIRSFGGTTNKPTLFINGTTNNGLRFYLKDSGLLQNLQVLRREGAFFDLTAEGTTDINSATVLFEAEYTTQTIIRLNGNLEDTGNVGAYVPYTDGFSFLGAGTGGASAATGTPTFWGSVNIGEELFYNNVKSGTDRNNVINYLKGRWNIP